MIAEQRASDDKLVPSHSTPSGLHPSWAATHELAGGRQVRNSKVKEPCYVNKVRARDWDRLEDKSALLIFDEHGSHLDVEVLELAGKAKIEILCLPPHSAAEEKPRAAEEKRKRGGGASESSKKGEGKKGKAPSTWVECEMCQVWHCEKCVVKTKPTFNFAELEKEVFTCVNCTKIVPGKKSRKVLKFQKKQ